ncbi:MAG: DUF5615 family PIN-like protein [Cyanobacteria bacterium P01_A01_bin.123]
MWVDELRQLGHDVLTSYEADNANQRIPDVQVLAAATADNRCVVTFNRDDFVALHRSGVKHGGIVVCKADRDRSEQVRILYEYLFTQVTLCDRLLRVQKQNQPKASKQSFIVREYRR